MQAETRILKDSARTAMRRKTPAAPVRYLFDESYSLYDGSVELPVHRPDRNIYVLDYGCGYGCGVDFINNKYEDIICKGYDVNFKPDKPNETFDIILCNYVLNVLPYDEMIYGVIADIRNMLQRDGIAYITVRTDKKELSGWKCRGTFQRLIDLDLPIKKETSSWRMYELQKQT